jgi:hypothetical protein
LVWSSVCVCNQPNIEDIKSGKFHLISESAENALNKCFLDALKYPSCHLRNRLVAFVIDESHVIETWTGERKIQIQNAHFIFMHVPHNLSDHFGPLSQTSQYFAKELQNYLALLLAWASSLLKRTSMYLRMLLLKKHCKTANSFTCLAFFWRVNVFGVSFKLDITDLL